MMNMLIDLYEGYQATEYAKWVMIMGMVTTQGSAFDPL